MIIYGNNTNAHDTPENPFLHNQFKTKVHKEAKNNLPTANRIGNPLNNQNTTVINAMLKYILAGVHNFLKLEAHFFIIYKYNADFFLKMIEFLICL